MPQKSARKTKNKKQSVFARLKNSRLWDIRVLVVLVFMAAGVTFIVASSAASYALQSEFNGAKSTSPDAKYWGRDVGNGDYGWGNAELQYYTNGTANGYLDGNGHLVLEANRSTNAKYKCWDGKTCKYTSAKFLTKGKFTKKYGHIEARIQLSGMEQGMWPSIWMLGSDIDKVGWPKAGEIDIMESFGKDGVSGAMHGPRPQSKDYFRLLYVTQRQKLANPNGWHTYAVDWTANKVTYLMDGKSIGSVTKDTYLPVGAKDKREKVGKYWVFDHPFYILLNVAVGGNGVGNVEPKTKDLSAKMLVDYVRVW